MENTVSAIKEVTSSTVCKLAEMVQEDCLISANTNSKANRKDTDTTRKSEVLFNKNPALFGKIEGISEGANPKFAKHTDSSSIETPYICKQHSRGKVTKKSSDTKFEPRSSLPVVQESIGGNTPSLSNIYKQHSRKRVTKKSSETEIEPRSSLPVAQESIDGNTPSFSTIFKSGSSRKISVGTFAGDCSMSSGAIYNSALVTDACTYSDKNNMLDEANSKLKAVKINSKGDKKTENKGTVKVHGFSQLRPCKKKLLVLDLNGLLVDIISDFHDAHKTQKKISGKAIFKRPFCDEFLNFCFERFDVGVWSSRKRYNVDSIVDFLMRDSKHKLLFCWDESKCTYTGFKTLENRYKPLVLKELKKLWNKEESDLPWEKGDYLPSNTLLVDDSPYKALCNPKHTAIFPQPFRFDDEKDNSLGPEGDLRVYLEGISACEDVQQYVEKHPFGQHAITTNDASWRFYRQVIDRVEKSLVPAW